MAKKLTEEEMLEEALKNPKVRRVSGALRDIVPEAVAEYVFHGICLLAYRATSGYSSRSSSRV